MSTRDGQIDMKDIAIMDAFPAYRSRRIILEVGCGNGAIDRYLVTAGYQVHATDIESSREWIDLPNLNFCVSDIFDLSSFPLCSSPIVICSEVLEHLREYKKAFLNLLKLTEVRLIITVPCRRAFRAPGHCNYWDDVGSEKFKDIHEFVELSRPYSIAISKIITKQKDAGRQYAYLMVIDKRQNMEVQDVNRMV